MTPVFTDVECEFQEAKLRVLQLEGYKVRVRTYVFELQDQILQTEKKSH